MDKPIYVKITKYPSSSESWYNDEYLMNAIFEVVPCDETAARWIVKADLVKGASRSIRKSDCEVVPTLQPERLPNGTTIGKDFCNHLKQVLENLKKYAEAETLRQFEIDSTSIKSELGVVPEGPHLISTQQLKEMHDEVNGHLIMNPIAYKLEKWFPTVFVPAKTYKIKLEIDNLSQEEYTACITHLKDVADTAKGWRKSVILEETEK